VNYAAQQPDVPPPPRTIGGAIAASLDAGTIVTGILGFMMVLLINMGIGKLDKLSDGVAQLNNKMAEVVTRGEYQEKKDAVQDERLLRMSERIQHIEERVSHLEK
jgi:ubiquinone biosynthesis protein UbiJ